MSDERTTHTRREFLKGVLLGGGAAALAVTSGGAPAKTPDAKPASGTKPSQGYHVTDHIREYYKTAAI